MLRLRTYKGRLYILPKVSSGKDEEVEDIHKPHPSAEEYQKWPICVDSEFKFFLATNYPWLSEDFLASPNVTLNNGAMDVIWSDKMTKADILKVLLNPSDGKYVQAPFMKHEMASAFVLEPGDFWIQKHQIQKLGILNVSG
jgi:hypothetical protein